MNHPLLPAAVPEFQVARTRTIRFDDEAPLPPRKVRRRPNGSKPLTWHEYDDDQKERRKRSTRRWRARNRKKANAYTRRWYWKNRDKILARLRRNRLVRRLG